MRNVGAGTVVEMDYVPGEVKYRLNLGAGDDPYTGLDRFDRVVDLVWRSHASTDLERMKYGYDRASNRLWMERLADTNRFHDELYTYDGMHRLKTFKRGTLNAARTAITTLKFAQEWGLDSTGNWATFKEDPNGDATWDLVQSRTSNKVNEITAISETSGPSWVDPAYGKAGVMTTVPKPADPTGRFAATYDAWERLVKLMDGANTVVTNAYDGVNRLVVKGSYTLGVLTETRRSYYNSDWQCLEERVGVATVPDRHFIWGVRYIDDLICDVNAFVPSPVLNRFALNDVQFSVYALVGPDDSVHERAAYTAYGEPRFLNPTFGNPSMTSIVDTRFLFFGLAWDSQARLSRIRQSIWHPLIGSAISRDSMPGHAQSNRLAAFSSSPSSYMKRKPYARFQPPAVPPPIVVTVVTPPGAVIVGGCVVIGGVYVASTWISAKILEKATVDFVPPYRPPPPPKGNCSTHPILSKLPKCAEYPWPIFVDLYIDKLRPPVSECKGPEPARKCYGGEHYNCYNWRGKFEGSLLCCPCCLDTPYGAIKGRGCKWGTHPPDEFKD